MHFTRKKVHSQNKNKYDGLIRHSHTTFMKSQMQTANSGHQQPLWGQFCYMIKTIMVVVIEHLILH